MKLIVGLGNPGRAYANSRHNVGFQCLNHLARKHGIAFDSRHARARVGLGRVGGVEVVLAKPSTFVNLSGQAVAALLGRYRLSAPDLLVIYDDLDLPLGQIRIRERGGAGGHNGIKSIIAHLGTEDFPRLRVGIAPPQEAAPQRTRTPEYVLAHFTPEEKEALAQVYPLVAQAVGTILGEGLAAAMNRFN